MIVYLTFIDALYGIRAKLSFLLFFAYAQNAAAFEAQRQSGGY